MRLPNCLAYERRLWVPLLQMSIRVIRFGLLMLLPMTILGIGVILPVNYTGGYYSVETSGATPTDSSGVNVTDGSPNSTDYLTSQFRA